MESIMLFSGIFLGNTLSISKAEVCPYLSIPWAVSTTKSAGHHNKQTFSFKITEDIIFHTKQLERIAKLKTMFPFRLYDVSMDRTDSLFLLIFLQLMSCRNFMIL